MVVGGQGAFDGGVGFPVVPDRGGHGQEAGGDAGVDTAQGASAMVFEGELSFEGVEDRLDPLPVAADLPEPWWFVFAVGSDQVRAEAGVDEGLEPFACESLVRDDDLPGTDQMVIVFEQGPGDFPLTEFGMGEPQMIGMPSAVRIR